MGRFLLLGLLALPFVEIAGFIWVGSQIGILATLALIVLTAVLGVAIVRRQGLGMVLDSQAMMARGEVPQQKIAEMMMVAVAGFLLLLPGFLTDLVGLVLLVPPVRGWIYRRLSANMVIVSSYRPAPRGRAYKSIDLDPDDYRS